MMKRSVRPTPTATPTQTVGGVDWDCAESVLLLDWVPLEIVLPAVGIPDVGCAADSVEVGSKVDAVALLDAIVDVEAEA